MGVFPVRLHIRNHDRPMILKAHEPRAFARGQATRVPARLGNQNLRSILVVAGAQSPGDSIQFRHAEAKAVARRLVFCGVVPKVFPEVVGQVVFGRRIRLQNVAETGLAGGWRRRELERHVVAKDPPVKADDEDAFAVLGHPRCRVDHFGEDEVLHLLQRRANDLPGATLVVRLEVFHVFEKENGRALGVDDRCQVKEQCALCCILEAVWTAEAFLFGYTRD